MQSETTPAKSKNKKKSFPWIIVIIVVIVALGGIVFYQHRQLKQLDPASSDAAATQEETRRITALVSELMQLPDEDAFLATIQNMDELQGQAFFNNARNGDRVLIFPNAKKAVIYREGDHLIINAGPIEVNSATSDTPFSQDDLLSTPPNTIPEVLDPTPITDDLINPSPTPLPSPIPAEVE